MEGMFYFEDRVVITNQGSVFHGQEGVIGDDLDDKDYRWVWLDGHPFGMKFGVGELGAIS